MTKLLIFLLSGFLCCTSAAQSIETIIQKSGGSDCKDFTISSDGLLLAKINNGFSTSEIEIWNTKTGHLVRVISTNSSGAPSFTNSLSHVRFWKGSKTIITGTNDGLHEIYDVATGKLIRRLKLQSYLDGAFAVSEKTGSFVFLYPLSISKNQLVFYDLYSNTVYDSLELNIISGITAIEFSPAGDKISVGTEDGSFHVIELKTFNRIQKVENLYKTAIKQMQWTNDNYLLVSAEGQYSFWNLTNNKITSNGILAKGSRTITSLIEDCFYTVTEESISKKSGNGVKQKVLGVKPDAIRLIDIDPNNERLYVLSNSFVRVWDLVNIVQTECKKLEAFLPTELLEKKIEINQNFSFIPELRSCVYLQGDSLVQQPIDTNVTIKKLSAGSIAVNSLAINSSFLPITAVNKKITTFSANGNNVINTESNESILFAFPSAGKVATVEDKDSLLRIYDGNSTIKKIAFKGYIKCGEFCAAKQQFAVAGEHLYLVDAQTLKYRKLYDAHKEDYIYNFSFRESASSIRTVMPGLYEQITFSKNGNKLFAITKLGQIKVWNLTTFKIDTILNFSATQIKITPNSNRIFIASANEVIWMNAENFKIEAHIVFLEKGDYIVSLPDNYYKASRNGAKGIAFRKGINTLGFEQFDVIYNRPDIVTKRLGNPSLLMQEYLMKLHDKRLNKLGFKTGTYNRDELDAPETVIRDFNKIPTATSLQDFAFTIEAADKKLPLITLNSFINGVPFDSRKGFDLSKSGTTEQRKGINIKLSAALNPGKNFIEVSVVNEIGIESARQSFDIFYSAPDTIKPTLYFIGIAAGVYENEKFNLKYPAKDIEDVVKLFEGRSDMYKKIQVTTLTGKQVTTKAVTDLKQLLLQTNINDQVIIYWSGHGVLNKALNYYLATYNMDFTNPEIGGLEYADLENLLDSIPARKKLLFIDACHSGELDKEDIQTVSTGEQEAGKDKNKSNIKITLKNTAINLSALQNEMFADVRRNSGANVISAAGGKEYALEGDTWGNGVFTYALLYALTEKKADLNKDGEILISELQSYLQEKVSQLTHGRQRPTSRTENLVNDWKIW